MTSTETHPFATTMRSSKSFPALSTLSLSLLAVQAALAQSTAPAAEADKPTATLESVVVRAKRAALYDNRDVNAGALGTQSLQELPFSIGSFSSELVDNQRARTVLDVLKNDASVQAASFGGAYDGVSVRGFSANAVNAVRRDGLPTNVYSDIPLENKDRIDVLKGLSGFLYGVGEPSGLVNYVLKRPTAKTFTSLDLELRSYGGRYAAIDHSGSIGEGKTIGYRFNVAGEKSGDFSHAGDMSRSFVAAAFDFKLGADTLLRLDFDHQNKKIAAQPVIGPRTDGVVVPAESLDPRTLLGQPWGQYATNANNAGVRLEQALSADWDLTAQLGWSRVVRDAAFPDVYSVAPNGDVLSGDYYYEPGASYTTLAAQVLLNGRAQVFGMKHVIVTGLSDGRLKAAESGAFLLADTVGNLYNPIYTPRPDFSNPPPQNHSESRQPSLFFSDTIHISSQWRVLAGVRTIRYSIDSKPAAGAATAFSTRATVPSAALIWLPSQRVTVYGSYNEGLDGGGYAPTYATNIGERLEPIRSKQAELGLKLQPDESLSISAALFKIDRPLQAVDGADNVFKTLGQQSHRGLELSLSGELLPGLSAIAGTTWLDAKVSGTGDAREGKRPTNVAKFQANAFLDWRVPAVQGLSVNGGLFHVGNRPLDQANAVLAPAYTRIDAGARYAMRVGSTPVIWRLQVENLSNKRYWANVNYGGVLAGAPRTLKLASEWVF